MARSWSLLRGSGIAEHGEDGAGLFVDGLLLFVEGGEGIVGGSAGDFRGHVLGSVQLQRDVAILQSEGSTHDLVGILVGLPKDVAHLCGVLHTFHDELAAFDDSRLQRVVLRVDEDYGVAVLTTIDGSREFVAAVLAGCHAQHQCQRSERE